MGTRGPYALVDTTPAKTILVYRNGDQFYVGRKFVFSRRRVANFEALLEQLTEQVDVPFGVRRLYTPTQGHQVLGLDALQAGGKYVAAGRERFKKLDYIHIVPRKPPKMRKLKEIKPVVHCDINVPSRWQTLNRTSRYINVFTNGRLFIPPIKIIIPKFSLSDWNSVLAIIGEKVFPLGGVRKLFTMDGHLLDNSKDLQDNYFYVAAGLETFKFIPYWKSPRVPSEVQQKFGSNDKYINTKKKVESKGKELLKNDTVPPKSQDSVYYAKEKKKTPLGPLIQSGAEGDVYKAQTPAKETQEALEVREDPELMVEVPVDQAPAEIVKEVDELDNNNSDLESGVGSESHEHSDNLVKNWKRKQEKEVERLYEDIDRKNYLSEKVDFQLMSRTLIHFRPSSGTQTEQDWDSVGDHSRMSFKKRFPLRHYRKRKASLKNIRKNKEVVPTLEEEQHVVLEEINIPALPETQVEEVQREKSMGQKSQELSSTKDQIPEQQESSVQPSLGSPPPEKRPEQQGSSRQSSLEPPSPEQQLEQPEVSGQLSLEPPSPEQQLEQPEVSGQLSLEPPSPEQQLEQPEVSGQLSLEPPSPEQQLEQPEVSGQLSLEPPPSEQQLEQPEVSGQLSLEPPPSEQQLEQPEVSGQLSLEPPPSEQQLEQPEVSGQLSLEPPPSEQQLEQPEVSGQLSLEPPPSEQQLEQPEVSGQLSLEPPPSEQQLEQPEVSGQLSLEPPPSEQQLEQPEVSGQSSLGSPTPRATT